MPLQYDQLIEYNMKNLFFKKSSTKCGGRTSPMFFSKQSELRISRDQQSEIFIVCPSRDLPKYINTKVLTACFSFIQECLFLLYIKGFLKGKKRSGTGLLTSSSAWFF